MSKVCGTGEQCERTCPVMKMGRLCPDLPEFLEEVRVLLGDSVVPAATCLPGGSGLSVPQPV